MNTRTDKPGIAPAPAETDPRFREERPDLIGDFGQDDAFSTESHPEGLRYGERPHPPGIEHHGTLGITPPKEPPAAPLSVGSDSDS